MTTEMIDKLNIGGIFSRIELQPINLNSHPQVKKYLLSQGWQPTQWNFNKKTKERTSPKLTEDSFDSIEGEVGQKLARRNVLRHRRNYLENFEDDTKGMLNVIRGDGRISADAITCGTNTGRYKHKGVYCNIPSNYAPLGKEIRRCFVAPKGYLLVGCDLSGIEMRAAAHFAYKYDGGTLMDIVLNGDFHQEQADNVYHCSRSRGKSVTYAVLYGAGATKVASILGCSVREGQRIIDLFWDFNEGLGKLKLTLEGMLRKNRGYITNIDGRKTFIRAEYRLLNTLLQSSCAILFKRWLLTIDSLVKERGISTKMIAAYHDDTLHRCLPESVPDLRVALKDSINIVRDRYKIIPPLDIDILIGTSLDQCH